MTRQLQPAAPADLEAILALMKDYYTYDGHAFDQTSARRGLADLLNDPDKGQAWLILNDDEIAGYAVICFGYSLEYGGRDAFLDEFFLRDPFRGRGLGRWAMAQIEQQARQAGAQALHLQVIASNRRAEKLYRAMGYEERDRITLSKKLPT